MADLIFDDFSGTSLDPMWTRRAIASDKETWLEPGMTVGALASGSMYLQPAPAGTAWTVEVKFSKAVNTNFMVGPVILGATGTGLGVTFYHNPSGFVYTTVTSYGYGGSFVNDNAAANRSAMTRYRLRRDGSNYYTSYSTDDGGSWTAESAAHVNATTITQVGFGAWISGSSGFITVEEFKVFDAAPTSPTGTLTATLPTPTASLSGTYAPPAITGSMEAETPLPTVALSGTYAAPVEGALAVTLPTPTAALSGTYDGPVAGGLAATLPVPSVALSGDYAAPVISGSFDLTLPVPTFALTGTQADMPDALGTLAVVLPSLVDAVVLHGDYDPPIATPPATYTPAVRVEKAIAYPQPTLVNGRAT